MQTRVIISKCFVMRFSDVKILLMKLFGNARILPSISKKLFRVATTLFLFIQKSVPIILNSIAFLVVQKQMIDTKIQITTPVVYGKLEIYLSVQQFKKTYIQ